MTNNKRPTPEQHRAQIEAYKKEFSIYEHYAAALRRVLEEACKHAMHVAVVRARPKALASFAEKCVRKWEKYKKPAEQFNDLCGGRVVVQTLEQVKAVRAFVEANFKVVETEDVGQRLGEDKFGYRDRHYIVQLHPERARQIGFEPGEIKEIGARKAELQVRTWAQHAWADTLHDRLYKSVLTHSAEAKRTGALLAAIMEDGDLNFDRLATELDGMAANYAGHADRAKVTEEAEVQQLVLDQLMTEPKVKIEDGREAEDWSREKVALTLARLRMALGEHEKAAALLSPFAGVASPLQDEIEVELGTARCRQHREAGGSEEYQKGRRLISEVVRRLDEPQTLAVVNLRHRDSVLAKACSRLAWIEEIDPAGNNDAGKLHRQAIEIEPGNPYFLANMLGHELRIGQRADDIPGSLRPAMIAAVAKCQNHATQGIELPFSFFTAGRLRLLLGGHEAALHHYLRGAHHCLDEASCYGPEVIDDEIAWLHRIRCVDEVRARFQQAEQFLVLAKAMKAPGAGDAAPPDLPAARASIRGPVLILAGGAASISDAMLERLKAPLTEALRDFHGTVISGGTRAGIPGLVGEIAAELKAEALKAKGRRGFRLLGYRPERLPDEAPHDDRYDESIRVGASNFSAEQILANWSDILAARIAPTEVRVLGFGGGGVAAIEYRMALAVGACVGVVPLPKESDEAPDAVDLLLADPQWKGFRNLLPLPFDRATLRAFTVASHWPYSAELRDEAAKDLHERYRISNLSKIQPDNLRLWDDLPKTYQTASREQASYAIRILEAAGFCVRPTGSGGDGPAAITSFEGDEFKGDVERMAELEHGRWNVERLREGWRPGKVRDNEKMIQPCLVPWSDETVLTPETKDYDRKAARAFPEILAIAGLEIFRMRGAPGSPKAG